MNVRASGHALLPCVLLSMFGGSGCDALRGLGGPSVMEQAETRLKAGDLAGAEALYQKALGADPADVAAASGVAYLALLSGDAERADATLAAVQPMDREVASDVALRRALVALRRGDLDAVKAHGVASARAAGRLLAAEVELADGNREGATAHLEVAKGDPGAVGEVARSYIALLSDSDPRVVGYAETQALWALGERALAVRSVEDLVGAYAESREDGAEHILLWAGRAASVGEVQVAERLLDALTVPPPGQSWRVGATRAILACAAGDAPRCSASLASVQSVAPGDGYGDAVVTAAVALAPLDPTTARAMIENVPGDAAARLLGELRDPAEAMIRATDPVLKASVGG